MLAPLSTSRCGKQLPIAQILPLFALMVLLSVPQTVAAQQFGEPLSRRIEPLTAIDRQFMSDQRMRVEQIANQIGRRLSGNTTRDIDTLQRLLDRKLVSTDDTLTLQAMGIVLGDLIATSLQLDWVVYRDRAGRSRALHFHDSEVFLFPVTMISRRFEAGAQIDIKRLFDKTVTETRQQLPGGRWFQ